MVPYHTALTYINYAVVTVWRSAAVNGHADVASLASLPGLCSPGSHAVQPVHTALQLPAYRSCPVPKSHLCGYGDDSRRLMRAKIDLVRVSGYESGEESAGLHHLARKPSCGPAR